MTALEAIKICADGTDYARHSAAIRTLERDLLGATSGNQQLDRSFLKIIADCHLNFGDFVEAAQRYGEVVAAIDGKGEPQGTHYADALTGQARAYDGLQRYEEAGLLYQRALAIKEVVLGPQHQEIASLLTGLGRTYYRSGQLPEAEVAFSRALPIFEATYSKSDVRLVPILEDIAYLYAAQGRLAEAIEVRARIAAIQGG